MNDHNNNIQLETAMTTTTMTMIRGPALGHGCDA